ncbi:TetR/AcrR family transcriptional regulator [Martelella lutilitoris]|uniref:TetR/AcrR family transcriptional regulator n=1 Tax=Martelella lutilitoris TaxID=2583532 RepID=A0A7T7HN19_9HYPH|nr:TetR/AcrR family transcriptional regulator [Martelella lutilitoris]MAM09320.1 TetR family transcriptional regulator [Rhizobiaceae bacterium]QQM32229.1 TetR/AcrR family transcriptional regulator [Martelella lutilitoris]
MIDDVDTELHFTPRQQAVLEQALRLLVEGGEKSVTTAGIARAASCSKESLYKWFGDRDGLLSAMIAYQASKVRTFESAGHRLDADELRHHLSAFAQDLLEVLAGDVSLALNRLAIGRVTKDGQKLGRLLLERGRAQIDQRARALLEDGRRSGLLVFDNGDEAYRVFYGLIVGDSHVRFLLGEAADRSLFRRRAERAVERFWTLFAAA